MCGILGFINTKLSYSEIVTLNNKMSHRGPDDSTVKEYKFKDTNIFTAHNRLSIQDLATHANQPMENERYSIVFNGEVYNHFEIREKLNFNNFKTTSDTETLLWAFTELGIEQAIKQFIGMFAIGLFDKIENKMYLIRDRVGIKPLYWSYQNDEFGFSSELKGFPDHFKKNKSDKALIQFMSFGYIPNDNSYYSDIFKLKPAHYLVFDGNCIDIKRYWDLPNNKIDISYKDAVEESVRLIRSSIKYRLLADVEVGSFLSGGVDSSLVSAIMQQESEQKIKTFSIGFEDKKYDESVYAKEVARHIGSEHFEYKFKASDVINLVEKLDYHFDEPFGDASSLPMMILSEMTKKEVTVALSGDGGDELFLGYDRYFFTNDYFKKLTKIPGPLRAILSIIFKYSKQDKLEKMSYPLKNLDIENLYSILSTSIKPWEVNTIFKKDYIHSVYNKETISLLDLHEFKFDGDNIFDSLSRFDFHRYLPDDILTKVDRTTMAYGLEARVPILDHRIVEFAYSLPSDIKLQNGKKSILKDILYKQVPKKMIERPKQGFSVPLKHWFRGELKDILYSKIDNLDERFDKKSTRNVADLHVYKGRNYEYLLWNLLKL
jgi:asparagine synthase (glutamine-hydrolysing)